MLETIRIVNEFATLVNNFSTQWEHSKKLMSTIDKEISDIYHKIELNSFNAYQGYELSKQLQDALRRRREIKDNHDILHCISSLVGAYEGLEKSLMTSAKTMKQKYESLDNRKYTPRVLKGE